MPVDQITEAQWSTSGCQGRAAVGLQPMLQGLAAQRAPAGLVRVHPLGVGWTTGCRGVVNSRGSPIGEFSSWWAQPVTVASVPDGHRWHGYVLHIPPSSPHTYTLLKPCQPAGIQVRILPRLGNPSCLAWSGPGHACPTGQQA